MARENVHASGHVGGSACKGEVKAMGLFVGGVQAVAVFVLEGQSQGR